MATEQETARVWVGCLACYNDDGRLVGEWYDAVDADTVTPEQIHGAATSHEELWCFDLENMPGGKTSPAEAAKIGRALAQIEAPAAAVCAFIDNTGADDWDALPDAFAEAYSGEHSSEQDFAQELAEELGAVPQDYSWPASYIDWERATRDLFSGDYWSADGPGGVVYVFRTI